MAYRDAQGTGIHVAARTDVGAMRDHNEDAFGVTLLAGPARWGPVDPVAFTTGESAPLVLGVYDGCGGGSSGAHASHLAADAIHACLVAQPPAGDYGALRDRLALALDVANAAVLLDARTVHMHRGQGTTATLAAAVGADLVLAHVGDSRAYVLRRGRLVQVTEDDTLVAAMYRAGEIRREDVESHQYRNVITQVVGVADRVRPALSRVALRRGDAVLLCSDGIHGQLGDDAIAALLRDAPSPEEACRALVAAAGRAGGHDNATALVARFDAPWLELPSPDDAVPDGSLAGIIAGG